MKRCLCTFIFFGVLIGVTDLVLLIMELLQLPKIDGITIDGIFLIGRKPENIPLKTQLLVNRQRTYRF